LVPYAVAEPLRDRFWAKAHGSESALSKMYFFSEEKKADSSLCSERRGVYVFLRYADLLAPYRSHRICILWNHMKIPRPA